MYCVVCIDRRTSLSKTTENDSSILCSSPSLSSGESCCSLLHDIVSITSSVPVSPLDVGRGVRPRHTTEEG